MNLLAQTPDVTVINEATSFSWASMVTGVLPALVALLVVYIGGRQQRARQATEMAAAESRWKEERDFERERFAMQERRKLYADFLVQADTLRFATRHALAHGHHVHELEDSQQEAALHDWMDANDEFDRLIVEAYLVASDEFCHVAQALKDAYLELDVLGDDRQRTAEQFFDGDEVDVPVIDLIFDLEHDARHVARRDLGLSPSTSVTDRVQPPSS